MPGRRVATIVTLLFAVLAMAHVGSPDTFFSGQAGPYPVRVSVRLPGAVPGLAQISVRLPGTPPELIQRVSVQAIQWDLGPEGAPRPDPARVVPGDRELYAAELWLMVPTSYRVHVAIEGSNGRGIAVVPVLALATAQREMPPALGFMLAGLGLFLAVGLLTIVGAASRESTIPPGQAIASRDRRRARMAMCIAAGVLVLAVWGGRAWWNLEAFEYARFRLYRPFDAKASVSETGGRRTLSLTVNDARWPPPAGNVLTRYNALMPDHGKLMHMFLVREPGLDAFAHLHPVPRTVTPQAFDAVLPPLPGGNYNVYGDIVHESGYAQTLVAKTFVPGSQVNDGRRNYATDSDPDDSWFAGASVDEGPAPVFAAPDGVTIAWDRGSAPIVAREERLLTFKVRDSDGSPTALEPYMGMAGHAVVASEDGSVFAHLHPQGSISMAAMQVFEARAGDASASPHAAHGGTTGSEITIPYGFPKPGGYRLWVQVKRAGRVITAGFKLTVVG